ncbi:MAG: choline dehydrogenase [Rhodospirillaceae bacterium]|nr:choline dehydrogenase [Rhodospirillaceae bacterium]
MSDNYDFIVVGAGAAGCLLANRLSADTANRVLLLEAGGKDWNPLIRMPLAAGLLYFTPSLNWGYATEEQVHMHGRSLKWPRGKVLGGSTAINGMMSIRGQRQDYDDWCQTGLSGWSYEDVLPYFKSFEKNVSHNGDDTYHGRDGCLYAEKATAGHPLYDAWLECARAAGHSDNEDFNGATQEGVGTYDFNIKGGRRVSAAAAFLDPIRNRQNLTVLTRGQVQRVNIVERVCTGLECRIGGRTKTYTANREVILACGAVNSPQLLQLSGIGDGETLKSLDVSIVVDRPAVGQNLQDHIGVYLQHKCLKPITLYGLMRPDRAITAGLKQMLFGAGPAASVPLEVGGFLRTRAELDRPDIHVTFVPGLSLATTQAGQMEHGFLTNVYQLRPKSRGSISITSSNPIDKPRIDPNYLSDEDDIACLRDGVRLIRNITKQSALDAYRGAEIAPGVGAINDDQIDDWIRGSSDTIFHPVGSCRMGADEESVLDETLRVRGVSNLRVIDASAMPNIPSGNTSMPTMMIAEKGAAMILQSHRAPDCG